MPEYIEVGEDSRNKVENALLKRKHLVSLQWDKVTKVKGNQIIPVTCKRCEDVAAKSVGSLKKGGYTCRVCIVNNYTNLLHAKGFKYLSHSKHIAKVCCYACSSLWQTSIQSIVRRSKPKCETCLLRKYTDAALKLDFSFIRKLSNKSSTTVEIQCNKDLTNTVVPAFDLVNGFARCQFCKIENWRSLLAKKGCTFVASEYKHHGLTKKTRITYKNSNGEVFETTSGDLIKGRFATTKSTHWTSQHSTYLIVTEYNGKKYCKIGTAQIPQKRLEELNLLGKSEVFTLAVFHDRFGANSLESQLHIEFKNFRILRSIAEEFTTGFSSVRYVGTSKRVQVKHGTTEWFTYDVYSLLGSRYNLKREHNGIDTHTTDTSFNTG